MVLEEASPAAHDIVSRRRFSLQRQTSLIQEEAFPFADMEAQMLLPHQGWSELKHFAVTTTPPRSMNRLTSSIISFIIAMHYAYIHIERSV